MTEGNQKRNKKRKELVNSHLSLTPIEEKILPCDELETRLEA